METEALPQPVDGILGHFILKGNRKQEEASVSLLNRAVEGASRRAVAWDGPTIEAAFIFCCG